MELKAKLMSDSKMTVSEDGTEIRGKISVNGVETEFSAHYSSYLTQWNITVPKFKDSYLKEMGMEITFEDDFVDILESERKNIEKILEEKRIKFQTKRWNNSVIHQIVDELGGVITPLETFIKGTSRNPAWSKTIIYKGQKQTISVNWKTYGSGSGWYYKTKGSKMIVSCNYDELPGMLIKVESVIKKIKAQIEYFKRSVDNRIESEKKKESQLSELSKKLGCDVQESRESKPSYRGKIYYVNYFLIKHPLPATKYDKNRSRKIKFTEKYNGKYSTELNSDLTLKQLKQLNDLVSTWKE